MTDQIFITLAGANYPVAPLALGQMRRAGPAFTRIGISTPEEMGAQITLITLAMQSADPTVTPDKVENIKGVTFGEIRQAVGVIAQLMGVELKDAPQGESVTGMVQAEF